LSYPENLAHPRVRVLYAGFANTWAEVTIASIVAKDAPGEAFIYPVVMNAAHLSILTLLSGETLITWPSGTKDSNPDSYIFSLF